ncbi:Uncharacterised protein [Candidatus Tiddalikarchaeum anstoanum]|nr:Uncharacterised protein [Candidatus Tiddalikarchaeum anstoanum]
MIELLIEWFRSLASYAAILIIGIVVGYLLP